MSTRPPLGCSVPNMVQRYLGTEYDKVKSVADNIDYVKDVAESFKELHASGYIGDTPPTQPKEGEVWYCSLDGRTYIWHVDADSSQWVESNPQSDIATSIDKMTLNADATDVTTAIALVNQIRAGLIVNGLAQ